VVNELDSTVIWHIPDSDHLARVLIRLGSAAVLGGFIGVERQLEHKLTGIRTHMLVALGAALFTLVPLEAGLKVADLSRVIQGLAAGIGFLGAGTIIQLDREQRVKGLTSAASIWLTAAIGMAVGAGLIVPAALSVVLALAILWLLHIVEKWLMKQVNPVKDAKGPLPPGQS
jgi:putative Mg2+ transporter-C (MgtC) family protein